MEGFSLWWKTHPQNPPLSCSSSLPSSFMHPNPIGSGLGNEAIVEAEGPDCIVPGQITPIKLILLMI
ncbi:hypothetical protein ACSBR2_014858 [Camellia fascicularis]